MKMNAFIHRIHVFSLLLMILVTVAPLWATASSTQGHPAFDLLKIGKPATGNPDVKVSTDRPASPGFMPGDRPTVRVTTRRDLYLLVVNVSSKGTVTILFPNGTVPGSRLKSGKEYSFFAMGSDLGLVLGDQADGGGTALYLGSKPVDLSGLKPLEDGGCITLSEPSVKELSIIRKELTALAGSEGFSRIDLPFKDDQGNRYDVVVIRIDPKQAKRTETAPPAPGAVHKGLPSGLKSDRPESITGTAGHRPDVKDQLGDSRK